MPFQNRVPTIMKEMNHMQKRTISAEDLKRYLSFSKEIDGLEETLYESGKQLDDEESRINNVVAEQNKIRFDKDENDIFGDQLETVIETLAENYREFGFDYNLYFDLVYNLLLLDYEKMDQLKNRNKGVADMFDDIEISGHLKDKVKSLLDHEVEMEEARKTAQTDE
jgi:hypothetical protein